MHDTTPSEAFDRLTRLAARVLGAPSATIVLRSGAEHEVLSQAGPIDAQTEAFCRHVAETGAPSIAELGSVVYCGVPLRPGGGEPIGALCVQDAMPRIWAHDELACLDDLAALVLTEIDAVRAVRAARNAEHMFRTAFDHAPHGAAMSTPDGRFIRVNQVQCDILGYPEEELLGMQFLEITHPDDHAGCIELVAALLEGRSGPFAVEKRYVRKDGRVVWCMSSVALVRDGGEPLYLIGQLVDVTDRKRTERDLQHMADHDPLTGLVNRRRFREELASLAGRRDFALVMLDLDGFKEVNDAHGHLVGDELLRGVSAALRGALRPGDVLGRLGGDEFAALLPDTGEAAALGVAERLIGALRGRALCEEAFMTTASAGVAVMSAGEARDEDDLLGEADLAMYAAKAEGGDAVSLAPQAVVS